METYKILKYLNDSASLIEAKEIKDWIEASEENAKTFNFFKAQHIVSTFDETVEITDLDKGFDWYNRNIEERIRDKKRNIRSSFLKYAAMVIVVFGSAYIYHNESIKTNPKTVTPKDVITLQLENGKTQIIEEDGNTLVFDSKGSTVGSQKGNILHYNNGAPSKKLIYNTLTVPNGKRFDIVLSDGTRVFLNAGTSLKYPIKFIKGQNREVFLTGEAFFEVAKDTSHPFVVNANDLNVRVLGTKFNVSAYPEDVFTQTVLVEGSVGLYQKDTYNPKEATLLAPGHLASWHRIDNNISLKKVDISIYTSWINGTILFSHESFINILKKLERHYNVVITNNNKELNEVDFTGSFDNVTLEYILKTFHDNYGIEYTNDNNNNNIIINPKNKTYMD
jgi:transmembrane sensor